MDNFQISTRRKSLKELNIIGYKGLQKDRIDGNIGEGLFFLMYGYKLNKSKDVNGNSIDLFATGEYNKMDFYYSLNGEDKIGIDYELTGNLMFEKKEDSLNQKEIVNKLLESKKLGEESLLVKYGYPKIITRKLVDKFNHQNLLQKLNGFYQREDFKEQLFEWDLNLFNKDFYQKIENDNYNSKKNIFNSYVNISDYSRFLNLDSYNKYEVELKEYLFNVYQEKKTNFGYKEFYLQQHIINSRTSESFYTFIYNKGIINVLSDFIEHYQTCRKQLNNDTGTISWLSVVNSFKDKELLFKSSVINGIIEGMNLFDSITINIGKMMENIKDMDFVYEKTDEEKKDYSGKTISSLNKESNFSYRIYLFPKTENIIENITIDKLPI